MHRSTAARFQHPRANPYDRPRLSVSTIYRTARVVKRVRSTNLYHSTQCGVVLKPGSGRIERRFYDERLQQKLVETIPVQAECDFNRPISTVVF